jgi:hypothetical protein
MNKIICSLEEWDSIIDYHRPNASSKTWYINELKKLTRPLMWGEWNIYSEQGEMFDNKMFRGLITPDYSKNIEYKKIDEIGNSNHLYIINVYSYSFFADNLEIGFKCVSPKYLEDVRKGRCKILLLFLYEGYSGSKGNWDLEIIEKWRVDSELPKDSIYYICGNFLIEDIIKQKGLGFQGRPIHCFEPWNTYNETTVVNFKPIDDKFLFLSYNRNPRPQRITLLLDLLEHKIFDRGLVSLNNLVYPPPDDCNIDDFNYLKDNAPFIIDQRYNLDFNLACNITKEDYERTFVSLLTESLADDDTLFLSEKIWKPIMVGHPFIVYGNQHTLRHLKTMGYQTFNKWIDESYDDEPERGRRSKKVVEQIKRFENHTVEQLTELRNEMRSVCEYNQSHYRKLYNEKYNEGINLDLEKIIKDIWKDLIKWI